MNAILSIKPRYCEEITKGTKKYEFRKRVFRRENRVGAVFMYSTYPVKKIVGVFTIEAIIEDHPRRLWERCKESACMEEQEFLEYFGFRKTGFAIGIEKVRILGPVDPKTVIPEFSPPQSFCYVEEHISFEPGTPNAIESFTRADV